MLHSTSSILSVAVSSIYFPRIEMGHTQKIAEVVRFFFARSRSLPIPKRQVSTSKYHHTPPLPLSDPRHTKHTHTHMQFENNGIHEIWSSRPEVSKRHTVEPHRSFVAYMQCCLPMVAHLWIYRSLLCTSVSKLHLCATGEVDRSQGICLVFGCLVSHYTPDLSLLLLCSVSCTYL